MNIECIRQVAAHLRERSADTFSMADHTACIMRDVRDVFGIPAAADEDFRSIGAALDLENDEAWELFFAGDISHDERPMTSFTKDEALAVLDSIAAGDKIIGIWRRTVHI